MKERARIRRLDVKRDVNNSEKMKINKKSRRTNMKKLLVTSILLMSVCLFITVGFTQETAKEKPGESMFKKHCAICHRDGGNIINPKKTLHKKDLDASNFKKADDIVKLMRNGMPGMPKFNEKTIPDKDAREIAEYILKTFK